MVACHDSRRIGMRRSQWEKLVEGRIEQLGEEKKGWVGEFQSEENSGIMRCRVVCC